MLRRLSLVEDLVLRHEILHQNVQTGQNPYCTKKMIPYLCPFFFINLKKY